MYVCCLKWSMFEPNTKWSYLEIGWGNGEAGFADPSDICRVRRHRAEGKDKVALFIYRIFYDGSRGVAFQFPRAHCWKDTPSAYSLFCQCSFRKILGLMLHLSKIAGKAPEVKDVPWYQEGLLQNDCFASSTPEMADVETETVCIDILTSISLSCIKVNVFYVLDLRQGKNCSFDSCFLWQHNVDLRSCLDQSPGLLSKTELPCRGLVLLHPFQALKGPCLNSDMKNWSKYSALCKVTTNDLVNSKLFSTGPCLSNDWTCYRTAEYLKGNKHISVSYCCWFGNHGPGRMKIKSLLKATHEALPSLSAVLKALFIYLLAHGGLTWNCLISGSLASSEMTSMFCAWDPTSQVLCEVMAQEKQRKGWRQRLWGRTQCNMWCPKHLVYFHCL